jgi:NAD(P)H-flavin reductase
MIWAFDRLLRLGRIFCFNVLPWTTKAIAVYDKSANIVRLKIPCETSVYQPRPGTYYYLMVLNDVRCWESHPFTLASVSHAQALAKDFEEDTPLLESNSSGVQCSPPDPEHTGYVSFLIRPYDSFTARLRHLAGSATLRVLVEGPYGSTWPLHRFDNVLFVVGGSGIVVALSYLRSLLSDSAKATFVQIHWAVRETQLVEDVIKKDIGDLLFSERLTVQVYTTSMVDQLENPDHAPSVRFHRRRLDVHALVGEATERAKGGNLAVVACGPARMADDTRQAAVSATGKTSCDVQYFEEDFQW